jgi:DNA invertase Pin-like site-specific DNA recombinase
MSGNSMETTAAPAPESNLGTGRAVRYTRASDHTGEALRDCLESLRPGDVLVVAGLDQLGRTPREVIAAVGVVRERGAGLRSLLEDLDTTGPGGDAIFRAFGGLADLGRAAISAGTSDGLAAARARGKRLGRPPALTQDQLREVRDLLLRPESTVSGVARQLGVSRSTIYKYLPDVMHAGAAGPLAAELDDYAHGRAGTPAAHLAAYQARPGRGVLVIDDLADLNGPTAGTVELPLRLFWHPNRRFNLEEPGIMRWLYQVVLREASRPDDLARYLNGDRLVALWPDLRLPKGVKRAWEEHHPSLRSLVEA